MKKSFYQWLIRAVLALVCLLTTTSAWAGFNIYVNSTSGDFYIYMWDGGSTNGWPGNKLNSYSTTTINNKTWYVIPISASSTMYILNNGNGTQTGNLSATGDVYLEYSGANTANDVTNEITNTPDTYTVAGSQALFGSDWNTTDSNNEMTTTDNVIFTWSKENVTLSQGTIEFKVVKNHSWNTAYPTDNYRLDIPSNGIYNVTITFDSSNNAVNATATAVQTTPDVYYVRGNSTDFFGENSWGNSNNVMTTTDDTHYTWTSGQANLAAGTTIEFKVVKNGSEWIGDSNGNNVTCTTSQAGIYTLTVTYTAGGNPQGTLNLISEIPDAPTFSPAAGTYNSNQSVTITATSGATVYYTTDGSAPTTSSTVYSGAIALNSEGTTTIKAIAVKNGQTSAVAEATYTIAYDHYYVRGDNVDFFGSDSWNTNANEMTTTDNTNYTWTSAGQAQLNSNATVKFKLSKNGSQWIGTDGDNNGSNIVCTANVTGVYTLTVNYTVHGVPQGTLNLIAATPEAPTFSPVAGAYNSNQSVTITATSGATIYYTTDGSTPTTSSAVYSGAIALNSEGTTTIKAIAAKNGLTSAVAEATYTIQYDRYYVVGEPNDVFPSGWSIGDAQLMTANGTTWTWTKSPLELADGATIAFKVKKKTVDGETWIPDGSGNNITVSPEFGAGNYSLTINYVEGENAPIGTLTPLFSPAPKFTPAAGTYDTNQNVTITALEGTTIYYTTDGTDPETSETRIAYTGPISVAGEGEHVIKAVAYDGTSYTDVATAEYVIKYLNIYVMGSVGKAHAWVYDYSNPELITSDGITYSGVIDVLTMTSDPRPGAGLFVLTTGYGSDYDDTKQYMIGAVGNGDFWIDGEHNYLGEWVDAAPIGQSKLAWSIVPPNGHGTYEFFYDRANNKFMLANFDGPTIYVYDYTRPYIYVEDADHVPYDGVQPGNPIQILDETVGGHSGLSAAANGTGDGLGSLGWYKFAVPSHNYPFHFQFHHNGDKKVIDSPFYEDNNGDVYYYWDGAAYQPLESRADADKLSRIVAHVRVQGTTVPTCDGVEMNGPSSFYGQMYYWMAVTTFDKGENVVITDGNHHYEGTLTSDIYLEWTDENAGNYVVLDKSTLEQRLATKTGRGTVIHLLKNKNTPTNNGDYVLGIDTEINSNGTMYNSTNVGVTWWGNSIGSTWAGTESYHDGTIISNYNDSRFLYAADGVGGNPDVFTITAENGTEWYTWYSDRSTATIKFGYGTPKEGYPNYLTGGDNAPEHPENVYKFYANYESPQTQQTAGELWYVWTPDFNAELNGSQSQNNGELIDVTRTYESRAKQKALCSTFRDGNYVYYTDIKGWGDNNVYCYAWTVPGLEWPGVQMVKVGYDDEGHPVYLADLSNFDVSNATGIIFNNGHAALETDKRQTGDLPFENQGCYDYLGLLYRIGGNVDVIENEPDGFPTSVTLTGVWYSRVKGTLLAKGDNDYNNKSINGMGYKDFAKTVSDGNEDGSVLQSRDYDQSNWVEIYPSEDGLVDAETLISLIGKPFTLYGTKTNSVNPTFTAISISNVGSVGDKYQPNHFTPIHLNGSCYQYRNGEKEWYFFVEPKPNEFAIIDWATYREDSDGEYFYTNSNTGFDGEFVVDWGYFDKFNQDGEATAALEPYQMEQCGHYIENLLKPGESYKGWFAIIKVNPSSTPAGDDVNTKAVTGSTGKYTVCPVYISDEQIMTAIENINVDRPNGERTLKATRYYNMMGVESNSPFQGVNIIVKEYTDGSRESSKVIMR